MGALRDVTAQELLQYSHEPYRTELIAGRLVEMEPAGGLHGVVTMQIGALLWSHVRSHALGKAFGAETGYVLALDPDTVRAPDASYLSYERIEAMGGVPHGFLPGPPDVAFEVTSPRDRRRDVEAKTRSWLDAGTKAVVVLDPRARTATVHRPDGSVRAYDGSACVPLDDVLHGFAPALDAIFA